MNFANSLGHIGIATPPKPAGRTLLHLWIGGSGVETRMAPPGFSCEHIQPNATAGIQAVGCGPSSSWARRDVLVRAVVAGARTQFPITQCQGSACEAQKFVGTKATFRKQNKKRLSTSLKWHQSSAIAWRQTRLQQSPPLRRRGLCDMHLELRLYASQKWFQFSIHSTGNDGNVTLDHIGAKFFSWPEQ